MDVPKGRNAIFANLKNCIPKGIPTIVIHPRIPNKQDITPNSQPIINIQIMFSKKVPVPLEKVTSLPKGQNINEANLKHCIPTGMAIIVQQQITPTIPHNTERTNPPNTSHNILPTVFTLLLQSIIFCCVHLRFLFLLDSFRMLDSDDISDTII